MVQKWNISGLVTVPVHCSGDGHCVFIEQNFLHTGDMFMPALTHTSPR